MNPLDRVDSFPEPWKPEPGDKLTGTVVEVGERVSEFSDAPYPLVTILADHGIEFVWHGFHTVAKNELARQKPRVGDKLAVKYFGRDAKGAYEKYRVVVVHAEPQEERAPDWERMAKDSAHELTDAGAPPEIYPEDDSGAVAL